MPWMLSLITVFLSFSAHAEVDFTKFKTFGGVTSGGGYVIVCENADRTIKSIELLDFFEASQTIRGYELRELPAGADAFERAEAVVARINAFSKGLSKSWMNNLASFKKEELTFIDRGVITDINDARTQVSPGKSCYKVQAAVQLKNPGPYQYRVMVDKDLWNKMDDLTRTGLLVHEAIYHTALEQQHEDSDKVRMINSFLFSKYTQTFKTLDYLRIFKFAKIDGCFENSFKFFGTNPEVLFHSEVLSLKISKTVETEKGLKGEMCGSMYLANFLGEEGDLIIEDTSTIYLNSTNNHLITHDNFCVEQTEVKDSQTVYRFGSHETGIKYQGLLCFMTSLEHNYKTHFFFAGYGNVQPPVHFENTFSRCEYMDIVNQRPVSCRKVDGALTIANRQRLPFDQYLWDESVSTHLWINYEVLPYVQLGTSYVFVRPEYYTTKKKFIGLRIAGTELVWINYNEKVCSLQPGDQLIYEERGAFKGFRTLNGHRETEESCSRMFPAPEVI